MDSNKLAFTWPEHHVSAAWWVAAVLSAPWWASRLWAFFRVLPIWGRGFAQQQRAIIIRVLERIHGDTERLVLYMSREALAVALDLAFLCFAGAIFSRFSSETPRRIAFICF